jgi:hypothetical protein
MNLRNLLPFSCILLLLASAPLVQAQPEYTQPGRSEVARLLGGRFYVDPNRAKPRRYEDDLFKGVSIWPVGQIQAGKRTFLIAKRIWEQAPEDIAGTQHGRCELMVLERRNGQMRELGRYDLQRCGTPHIEGQQIRFMVGNGRPGSKPRVNRLTLTEKGPPREAFLDDDETRHLSIGR